MKKFILVAIMMLGLCACTPPPGWTHYITARDNPRDAYSYDRIEGDLSTTIWAVIFDEGHPTLVDCTLVDC